MILISVLCRHLFAGSIECLFSCVQWILFVIFKENICCELSSATTTDLGEEACEEASFRESGRSEGISSEGPSQKRCFLFDPSTVEELFLAVIHRSRRYTLSAIEATRSAIFTELNIYWEILLLQFEHMIFRWWENRRFIEWHCNVDYVTTRFVL